MNRTRIAIVMKRLAPLGLAVGLVAGCAQTPAPTAGPPTAVATASASGCAMDCAAWGQTISSTDGHNWPSGQCIAGKCGTYIVAYGNTSCAVACESHLSPRQTCVGPAFAWAADEVNQNESEYRISCDFVPTQAADLDDGVSGQTPPWPADFDYTAQTQWCFCGPAGQNPAP